MLVASVLAATAGFAGNMAPFANLTSNLTFASGNAPGRRLQGEFLDPKTCRAYLSNPRHRFHNLWSPGGWTSRNSQRDPACWNNFPTGESWFARVWDGLVCDRNWYSGNNGQLGAHNGGPDKDWVWPHFSEGAAALLGFDESIDHYCYDEGGRGSHAESCVKTNNNILSLFDGTYNTCRNLEWQVCAARGLLPGQRGHKIKFGHRPSEMWTPHIGSCTGYHPAGCGNRGYASSDIYYLEICMYSMLCKNRDELFDLQVGEEWECAMDPDGFQELQEWVLDGLSL